MPRTIKHELVDGMVNWFNQIDTSYRSELRELNDLNFARFDAKLEQRLAEMKAELRQEIGQVRAELRQEMAGLRADLIKWMFVFWVGNFATTAGLVFALAHFSKP